MTKDLDNLKLMGLFPGHMAPKLEADTLAGDKLKLADYRGKMVLITFGTSDALAGEVRHLKKAREKYKDDKLAIIGVSFDADAAAAKSFVAREGLQWPHIWAEGGEKGKLAESWYVKKAPVTLLINRDGKVAATDLRGSKIVSAITEEVKKGKE